MYHSQIMPDLYLIRLDQELRGFREFIGSWLYKSNKLCFIVDPGPLSTIENLADSLRQIEIDKIDYILLTHIHIDHSGGTGRLAELFPDAKVVCHPAANEHLVDPSRLWKSSRKILGKVADLYGEGLSVPENRIFNMDKIQTQEGIIEIIKTPGHSVHHQCFLFGNWLFAGEVAGVMHPMVDAIYTRPATPPVFKLELLLESINRVVEKKPEIVFYGHFGFLKNATEALITAGDQLLLWADIIRSQLQEGEVNIVERSMRALLANDEAFANYKYLDEDIQEREKIFIDISINGILEYIRQQ